MPKQGTDKDTPEKCKAFAKFAICYVREGKFLIGGGGGGPGLRRGGSLVNILQIGEGQTCFIRNRGRVA